MILPILISVSVAPMSYFFCADAPLLVAANIARAAERAPSRRWIAGISISLGARWNVWLFNWSAWRLFRAFNTLPPFPATESPSRWDHEGLHLVARPIGRRRNLRLVAGFAADDVAEQLPFFTLEAHQLKLLDRREVGGRGVDLDAGKQRVGRKILQACGLLHHGGTGQIVAAHLQHLHQRLRGPVAEDQGAVALIALGIISGEEGRKI